jgi:hypothetical protein
MDALAAASSTLAGVLAGWAKKPWGNLCGDAAMEWFGDAPPGSWADYFADLYQLAAVAQGSDPANAAAYDAVMAAVDSAVIYEMHRSDHPNAHGISVYFQCAGTVDPDYTPANLIWAADTGWHEMLLAH